jgi:hypothetical protein
MSVNDSYEAGSDSYVAGNDSYAAGNGSYEAGSDSYVMGNGSYAVGNGSYEVGIDSYAWERSPTGSPLVPTRWLTIAIYISGSFLKWNNLHFDIQI